MIEHKHIGFICKKIDFKDYDAIFNVLTSQGKKTFKGRGVLKITSKNSNACNYFMLSEFITQSKTETSNQTLKTANIIRLYKKPYEQLLVSSSYLFICSLLDGLSDEINGYEMALKCFDYLEDGIYPITVLNYFLKNVCNALGYTPNLKGCVLCGKMNNLISFNLENGGYICKNCFDVQRHEKYSTSFLKELYSFLLHDTFLEQDESNALSIFKIYHAFFKDVVNMFNNNFEFVLKCI